MGQKVNPIGFRVGYIRDWGSRWFAKHREFGAYVLEDLKIRNHIKKNFASASISRVDIERSSSRVRVIVYSARPGVIIGRRGADIDRLRDDLQESTKKEVYVDIKEVQNPALDAQLVAENIAYQLEKRIAFRRAMKKAVSQTMNAGGEGIKIICAGRLGGAEIARSESTKEGKIPLHTLRANVDYGFAEARTNYGVIGVKCWLYKGMVITGQKKAGEKETAAAGENK